jgi:hypothetical protein
MEYGYKLILLVEGRIQRVVSVNTVMELRSKKGEYYGKTRDCQRYNIRIIYID